MKTAGLILLVLGGGGLALIQPELIPLIVAGVAAYQVL